MMSATAGSYLGFFGGNPPGRFSCRGGVTGFCQPPPPLRMSSPSRGGRGGGGGVWRLSAIALLLGAVARVRGRLGRRLRQAGRSAHGFGRSDGLLPTALLDVVLGYRLEIGRGGEVD